MYLKLARGKFMWLKKTGEAQFQKCFTFMLRIVNRNRSKFLYNFTDCNYRIFYTNPIKIYISHFIE